MWEPGQGSHLLCRCAQRWVTSPQPLESSSSADAISSNFRGKKRSPQVELATDSQFTTCLYLPSCSRLRISLFAGGSVSPAFLAFMDHWWFFCSHFFNFFLFLWRLIQIKICSVLSYIEKRLVPLILVVVLLLPLCHPMSGFPCPSLSPRVCSNTCPLSWWCHPTISSSVIPFSSYLQSFPASGSFLISWPFTSGGQSIGASASNQYSGLVSFKVDWFDFLAVQESSPIPQFNSISSSALSLLYGPTLTSSYRFIFLSSVRSQHFGKSCPNPRCPFAQAPLGPQCPASWISSQPL